VDIRTLGQEAMTLHRQGRLAEAESRYRQILAIDPRLFPALFMLGSLRLQQGDSSEAADLLGRALQIAPGDCEALTQHGLALIGLGRFADAASAFNQALASKPGTVLALTGRAAALRGLERTAEALSDFDAAVALDPTNPDTWNGRGAQLRKLGRIGEALESFDRALALWPDFAEALQARGELLSDEKNYPAALTDLERAMALDPARPALFENLLHVKMMMAHEACDLDRAQELAAQMPGLITEKHVVPPMMLLLCCDDPPLQRRNAENLIAKRFPPLAPFWEGTRYNHDRIRLAYISSDFNHHAVAGQVAELIACHDRTRFEVQAISTGADDGGAERRRLMAGFDAFHDVQGQEARAIARRIRELEVDVLVDLNGHTQHDNFDVLRRRPAPAQVSWLGYAGTSGTPYIDALIADAVVVPDASAFSERLYLLPDTVLCADTSRAPAAAPDRAAVGLAEDAFVFCAFNRGWKITAPVFHSWMRILRAVPGSLLWLKQPSIQAQANLSANAFAHGVDPARLIYAPPLPLDAHLARHALADLFLDTFPYTGHATACDALWTGLPVVTRKGRGYAACVSASLLQAVGLPELVTETQEAYEALAIALARDPGRLRSLRERLRSNRATAPLFDTKRFARAIEQLYARILADRLSG